MRNRHLMAGNLRRAVRAVHQDKLRAERPPNRQPGRGWLAATTTDPDLPFGLVQTVEQQATDKRLQQRDVDVAPQAAVALVGQDPRDPQAGPAFDGLAGLVADIDVEREFAPVAGGLRGRDKVFGGGLQASDFDACHPHRQHRMLRNTNLQGVQHRVAQGRVATCQHRAL